jgi:hypothetical protein
MFSNVTNVQIHNQARLNALLAEARTQRLVRQAKAQPKPNNILATIVSIFNSQPSVLCHKNQNKSKLSRASQA